MFCRWCGERIENNGRLCPHCGREQSCLASGNAFWNLCEAQSPPDDRVEVTARTAETSSAPFKSGAVPASAHNESSYRKSEKQFNSPTPTPTPRRSGKTKKGHRCYSAVSVVLSVLAIVGICVTAHRVSKCLKRTVAVENALSDAEEAINDHLTEFEERLDAEESSLDESETKADSSTETGSSNDAATDFIENPEKTDQITIVCFPIENEQGAFIYIAEGELAKDESINLYWQSSVDSGESWQTIAQNTSYIVRENEDALYRVVCDTVETLTVELSDGTSLDNSDLPVTISKSLVTGQENMAVYQVESTPAENQTISVIWQSMSDDDRASWMTISRDLSCLVETDTLEKYRLSIDVHSQYYAIYQQNGMPNNGESQECITSQPTDTSGN